MYSNMYTPGNIKRQRTRDNLRGDTTENYFPGVPRIDYKPDAQYTTDEHFYYRYYNANERIQGRTMEEWLRPSIFVGRAFTPYPNCSPRPWSDTPPRSWTDNMQNIENYKRGIRAYFELCVKLGIKYWSGYDRDLAPEGESWEETQNYFEQVSDMIQEYQQRTGVRPLWIGVDFKNTWRYKTGAATNPESSVISFAGYQTKRAMDMAHKLNAECFMFYGCQEGYHNIMNTDVQRELKNYSRFMKLIQEYREKIGYRGQLLFQTVYDDWERRDEYKYCYNFFSCMTFMKHFNYDRYFKMCVKPGHKFYMANAYGCLGSVDIRGHGRSRGRYLRDMPNMICMWRDILEKGGLQPGGLTFYLPEHDGPYEPRDLAEAYITVIDYYAKALRIAVKMMNDNMMTKSIQVMGDMHLSQKSKYSSAYTSTWGSRFSGSDNSLEECDDQIRKQHDSHITVHSMPTRAEHCYTMLERYNDMSKFYQQHSTY